MGVVAIVLALGSSLSYGACDFLGGSQTRRTSLWTVLLISQPAGLVLMALLVLYRGDPLPWEVLPVALGAGLLTVAAAAAYYKALAIGVMAIIGPIMSLSVSVPVVVGLVSGERPSALQCAGIAVALGGVVLASHEKSAGEDHQATSRASIWLAALGASAWGLGMVLYAQGASADPYWSVTLGRAASVLVFALAFGVARPIPQLTRTSVAPLLAVGALEVGGFTLFSVASTLGYLSVVSILSSIYPAFLAILAYLFLHERLSRAQLTGVAAALLGVALIAVG